MRVIDWLKASRAPFFVAVMSFVCVGTAAAWHETGKFEWLPFAACILGVMLINGGINLTNDFFDHVFGADEANPAPTPFSGGSRAIQDGTFPARSIFLAAILCFALSALIGVYLVWRAGLFVLILGAFGVVTGYFYTAPPLKLGYRGFGEIVTGITVGPLPVIGAYYVQVQTVSWGIVVMSLYTGFMGAALLVINELPDAEADRKVGKRHLVARMSLNRAALAYLALMGCAFASIAWGLAAGLAPRAALLAFIAAPVGLLAFLLSYRWALNEESDDGPAKGPMEMIPAMGANVACLLLTSVLLAAGYLASGGPLG